MKTGHIIAEVRLEAGPNAKHFGQQPANSYPTILTIGQDSFSSRVLLEDHSALKPGAIIKVHFCFLAPNEALQKMTPGTEFSIWENGIVGRGTVMEIIGAEQGGAPDRR